ncbi:bifunctional DNA-formamidopyrimidine glycosylase/DNA-(apurinic or apyrimidinic site) lyase [Carnimonas nigrificans]|uniref:bifunctional DNA-formamidopyrimidine glycosylase/DNA-(apurinic or apyrimidinic site) lyase n=1 Tax=Carnimonas nigrificans TaxID=64323 RepID=UPI00046EB7A4|nr:bifunctional DNA-formamidopyrimidine glycosylase/DNA-(apurinic or apyrimidinic site) lyase [Carnimonas nigrificans]
MPELPEVETTLRGIAPFVEHARIDGMNIRERRFRSTVPLSLEDSVVGKVVGTMSRRAKYLLMPVGEGHLLWHLGMSGSLRLVKPGTPLKKHDHIELSMSSGWCLRYHDPRRFGFVDFISGIPEQDKRLARLGPEPLSEAFNGEHLYLAARNRKIAVKAFIMDNAHVVGIGNIYATEALFAAGIDPRRAAGQVSRERYERLAEAIKSVLAAAIEQGGTTLRGFVSGQGEPGYFAQRLNVYGRAGAECLCCHTELCHVVIGQRATVYCPKCQH